MKRKLCVVLPSHWSGSNGGAELQARHLVDALVASNRYDISYVTRRVAPGFAPCGYRVVRVGRPGTSSLLNDAPSLYRALASIGPEIIYQRVGGIYTAVCAAYAARHRCRMVWHVASDGDLAPAPGLGSLTRPAHYLEKRALQLAARHIFVIVTQTHAQAALLKRHHGRLSAAIVPNFQPPPLGAAARKADRPTVVWIANFKPLKRPEIFVRLAQRLADSNARFVMAGRLDQGRRSRALLREMDKTGNLEYRGELNQEEVHRLLESSHVLVNTSVMEGFPNTFIQAWLRNVAVVSLTVDPDGVLMEEGMGMMAGTEERLCRAVKQLLQPSAYRSSLVERARRHALAVHGLENTERLLAVLEADARGEVKEEAEEQAVDPRYLPSSNGDVPQRVSESRGVAGGK